MRYSPVILATLLLSCKENISETSNKKDTEEPRAFTTNEIKSILHRHSLPEKDSITDENTWIYYKEARWDTSFVMSLQRSSRGILGIYHEISPQNMGDSELMTSARFFDGFTFTIDTVTWNKIIYKSTSLLDTINHTPYLGCADCKSHILSYNGKFTIIGENTAPFEAFEKMLKKELVYPVYRERDAVRKGAILKE